jgi:hypothetical protein
MDPLAALRAGTAALLAAEGEAQLADTVRAAQIELAGAGERWSMGAREVTAQRVALVVPAAAFVTLTGDPAKLEAVRAAFAQAMRSPETELADLHFELLLPGIERAWSRAYRDAPVRDVPAERPDSGAVLAGAAALLAAAGAREAVEMLAGRGSMQRRWRARACRSRGTWCSFHRRIGRARGSSPSWRIASGVPCLTRRAGPLKRWRWRSAS